MVVHMAVRLAVMPPSIPTHVEFETESPLWRTVGVPVAPPGQASGHRPYMAGAQRGSLQGADQVQE